MNTMSIYKKIPINLQNIACSIEGYRINKKRFNKSFWENLKAYEERMSWTQEQLIEYRNIKLRNIVQHSYKTVPYYKQKFDELNIDVEDITCLEDLEILPILNKEEINKNYENFISNQYVTRNLEILSTSGSTGSSFKLLANREFITEQWAVWWRFRRNLGINFNEWCAYFASRPIVPFEQTNPPYWRTNIPGRQLHFSAFHGTNDNFFLYFKKLNESKIKWIHGYPSVITPFASFIIENELKFDYDIKFVTTGGENIYGYQRKLIEEAFGVKPYSHYGLTEGVANFSENINHNLLIDEDFAAVEFIKSEDEFYEIVGTSLTNFAMPLLRYKTNDNAILDINNQGKPLRDVNFIDGRSGEHILLPNGSRVGALSALFTATSNVVEAQIHQLKDYSLIISIVPANKHIKSDELLVRKLLQERIGNQVEVSFNYVNKIPRTPGGKLRYVISDLSN